MKNNSRSLLIITTIVCLLPMIIAAAVYKQLPSQIPIHFDSSGAADNYLPKAAACFGLPLLFGMLNIFLHFRYRSDPKKESISGKSVAIRLWVIPVISVFAIPISLFIALGIRIPIHTILITLVGLLIIVLGNYLPKNRQNFTFGLKFPWTLHSENNWNKTHRLAGIVWVIGGLALIVVNFLNILSPWVIIAIVVPMVLIPFVFSYSLYKRGI